MTDLSLQNLLLSDTRNVSELVVSDLGRDLTAHHSGTGF